MLYCTASAVLHRLGLSLCAKGPLTRARVDVYGLAAHTAYLYASDQAFGREECHLGFDSSIRFIAHLALQTHGTECGRVDAAGLLSEWLGTLTTRGLIPPHRITVVLRLTGKVAPSDQMLMVHLQHRHNRILARHFQIHIDDYKIVLGRRQ